MEFLTNYIKPELLVVAIVLYFIGIWLKNLKSLKDKYIPFVLGGIGILLSALYVLSTAQFNAWNDVAMAIFISFIQGILVAAASTYVNQLIKQSGKEE
ncbi:phage holin family protein [Lachnospiraceae bacterium LCP25S3_G4]